VRQGSMSGHLEARDLENSAQLGPGDNCPLGKKVRIDVVTWDHKRKPAGRWTWAHGSPYTEQSRCRSRARDVKTQSRRSFQEVTFRHSGLQYPDITGPRWGGEVTDSWGIKGNVLIAWPP